MEAGRETRRHILVLYFGTTPWNYSRHLTDLMDAPEKFTP